MEPSRRASFSRSFLPFFAPCLFLYGMSVMMSMSSVGTSEDAESSLRILPRSTENLANQKSVTETKQTSSPLNVNTILKNEANNATSQVYTQQEQPKKPIFFVHLHKSGGTTVCYFARLSGMKTSNGDTNCNTDVSGPNHNASAVAAQQTCHYVTQYVKEHKLEFIGIEAPHGDELPCGGFRTLSVMRHPINRLLSWINLREKYDKRVQQWWDTKGTHPPQYYFDGYPYVNCFVIRMLLGQERYRDPKPVDDHDLRRATARVDEFDAFVPLEYLNHPHVLNLLEKKIPEYHGELVKEQRKTRINVNEKKWFQPTPEFLERLRQENEYDIMLYSHVLKKLGIEDASQNETITTV